MEKLSRLYASLSTRLQLSMLLLSLVGIAFGVKSYLQVKDIFGLEESAIFLQDLQIQIGIALAVNVIIGLILNQNLMKPLRKLGDVMTLIGENRLSTAVPFTEKRNELGTIARRVQIFKNNAINLKNLQKEQEDVHGNAESERAELLEKIASEFDITVKDIVDKLNISASSMESTSNSMVSSVNFSNDRFTELNDQSSHASENVNNIAAAAEELSVSIENLTKQVIHSTEIAKEAVSKADSANRTIEGLSHGTEKIGQVMNMINDIAEQINLLALNATIEAARAGEAGKGFAVVASEVKNLANQTAKATDEIVTVITSLQSETSASVESIQEISTTINEINTISTTILGAINEQDASTREIARHIQEAAQYTNGVNDNIASVSDNSHKIGDSANAMLTVCSELTQHSQMLNNEMSKFVENIKTA